MPTLIRFPLFSLLALLLTNSPLQAASTFFSPVNVASFPGGQRAYPADMDADGDTDIVVCSGSATAWYERLESGGYLQRSLGGGAKDAWPVDIDGDGDIDVLVGRDNGNVEVLLNDGSQTFTSEPIGSMPALDNVRAADFDSDGDLDVVASPHSIYGDMAFFERTGDSWTEIPSTNGTGPLRLDDFDGDGDIDLIGSWGSQPGWWENTGDFTFEPHHQIVQQGVRGFMGAGDFDQDGDKDIIGVMRPDNSYVILVNQGDNDTFDPIVSDDCDSYLLGLSVGDLNADGRLDFFIWGEYTSSWYRNDGNLNFKRSGIGDWPWNMHAEIANFTNDLLPDIGAISEHENQITLWKNRRSGGFSELVIENDLHYPIYTLVDDMDDDGDNDVLAGSYTDGYFRIYVNDGTQDFSEYHDVGAYDYASAVASADFDDDGDTDFVGATMGPDALFWFEQVEPYAYASHSITTNYPYAGFSSQLAAIDMDNDGSPDVVSTNSHTNRVDVWYNNGSGVFTQYTVAALANARALAVIDLDQDGDRDIIVGQGENNGLGWFEQIGDGFEHHVIDEDAGYVYQVSSRDMDQDGDRDIVATTSLGVKLFRNDGAETFTTSTITFTYGWEGHVIADVDQDGIQDVYVVADTEGLAGWVQQDSDGNWELNIIAEGMGSAYMCSGGDVDQDGDIDLVVSEYEAYDITILLNDPMPGFESVVMTVTPDAPPVVAPPAGGDFTYSLRVDHPSPVGNWVQANVSARFPGGGIFPVTSRQFLLPANEFEMASLPLTIPAGAPAGEYMYIVTLNWNSIVVARDLFFFYKQPNGMVLASVEPESSADAVVPDRFVLEPVHPNPFNPVTTVSVTLPTAADLSVAVYNVMGQQVAELARGQLSTGTHSFVLDGSHLASGIYFVHASVPGELNAVQKVTLLK